MELFEDENATARKLLRTVQEFVGYIETNQSFIPNYGERYRYGGTINWGGSKRMVKKQQMRWTKRGVHLFLQTRTKMLNGELRDVLCDWYPAMVQTVVQTVGNLPLAV